MDDDDDYGADEDLLAAMAAAAATPPARPRIQQPKPQPMQQPTAQRLDRAPPATASNASGASGSSIVQPTPQALPQKQQSGSTILVSPRQRGNPVLTSIRSMAWEYSDVPADFVMGATTCALFLSLKYHRLHPEYIYTRVRNLQGKYRLRVLLAMVDIPNHEDALRELAKTALVNGVTLVLCWSAAEAARYVELYKSYEHAGFGAIRGQQPSTYGDRLVEFVTVPRSLNKSDAVALVSNFGSLRSAVNADPEQLGLLNGWGAVKVRRWTEAVEEPFRIQKTAKRTLPRDQGPETDKRSKLDQAVPLSRVPLRHMSSIGPASPSPVQAAPAAGPPDAPQQKKQFQFLDDTGDNDDEEEALLAAAIDESRRTAAAETAARQDSQAVEEAEVSGGVAAALARLREGQ